MSNDGSARSTVRSGGIKACQAAVWVRAQPSAASCLHRPPQRCRSPLQRDRVLGSRLQQRRGITNNASAHRGSAYNSGHRGGSRKQGLLAEHKDRTYLCRYLDSRQLSTKYNLCIQKNQSGMVNLATNYLFLIQFLLYKGVNYYCYSLHVHWSIL